MQPFATIFLRMVKMIIAPLLFATLVVGIASHGDTKQLGKIGLKTLIYFEIVTTLALFIGLIVGNILQPGVGFNLNETSIDLKEVGLLATMNPHTSIHDMIINIFPTSIVDAMATGNLLQIVVFSIIFALAICTIGKPAEPVLKVLKSLRTCRYIWSNIIYCRNKWNKSLMRIFQSYFCTIRRTRNFHCFSTDNRLQTSKNFIQSTNKNIRRTSITSVYNRKL